MRAFNKGCFILGFLLLLPGWSVAQNLRAFVENIGKSEAKESAEKGVEASLKGKDIRWIVPTDAGAREVVDKVFGCRIDNIVWQQAASRGIGLAQPSISPDDFKRQITEKVKEVQIPSFAAKHAPGLSVKYLENVKGFSHQKALREVVSARGPQLPKKELFPTPEVWFQLSPEEFNRLTVEDSHWVENDYSSVGGLMVASSVQQAGQSFHQLNMPVFPVPGNGRRLFRGMSLNITGMRNILENGLRLADADKYGTETAGVWDLVLGSNTRKELLPDVQSSIWVTTTPLAAAAHADKYVGKGTSPVVVTIHPKYTALAEQGSPIAHKRPGPGYYTIEQDVPREDINHIYVAVKGPGWNFSAPLAENQRAFNKFIWCEFKFDGEHVFLAPLPGR